MAQPLNPILYASLQKTFGNVIIARAGEGCYGKTVKAYDGIYGKPRYKLLQSGEYYRVNCPFCCESRHRLWIHHLWGCGMPGDESDKFWWAAHCFNDDQCLSRHENRRTLRNRVWDDIGRMRQRIYIVKTDPPQLSDKNVELPGRCARIDQLGNDHHAVQYLRARRFDPAKLATDYGVSYCYEPDPDFQGAYNRIVYPIHMWGRCVGWQARYIGELDWKGSGIPKYYTMPGLHVKQTLYGFDAARLVPFVIVTEGVTDVNAIGPGAVALYGKSMSSTQFDLLVNNWGTIVLLLDDNTYRESEDLYHRLRNTRRVVRTQLPDGFDPAKSVEYDPDYIWDVIWNSAASQGVQLC